MAPGYSKVFRSWHIPSCFLLFRLVFLWSLDLLFGCLSILPCCPGLVLRCVCLLPSHLCLLPSCRSLPSCRRLIFNCPGLLLNCLHVPLSSLRIICLCVTMKLSQLFLKLVGPIIDKAQLVFQACHLIAEISDFVLQSYIGFH